MGKHYSCPSVKQWYRFVLKAGFSGCWLCTKMSNNLEHQVHDAVAGGDIIINEESGDPGD